MSYTIYDKATGRIERTVDCPPEMFALQFDPQTQGALDGAFDDSAYYISAGQPVAMPVQPSPHHRFDWASKTWNDPRSLDDHRAARWTEIKRARSAAEFGGFDWDGSRFDSDAASQSRIQGAAQLAQLAPEFTIDWTLNDNTIRTLNASQMLAVGIAMGQHISAAHAKGRVLRADIAAATTVDAINLIVWDPQ